MEREMQPQSPAMLKTKGERTADNPSTSNLHPRNVGDAGISDFPNLFSNPASGSQDQINVGSSGVHRDHSREGQNNPSENLELQLVLYNPSVIGAHESGNATRTDVGQTPSSRQRAFPNQRARGSPQVLVFAVQCANCFKWRLVPSKEKYEELREHILEQPFFCETAQEWRPDISCNEPADIVQDGTRLWAIDKPSIARTPLNWQRKLRIRAEGGTKFADVYYVSPTGKRLRSLTEVERFFTEHPEYLTAGISLEKFSFQLPKPLQQNYVRRRPTRPASASVVPLEASPLSWATLGADRDELVSRASCSGSNGVMPEDESAKKRKTAA